MKKLLLPIALLLLLFTSCEKEDFEGSMDQEEIIEELRSLNEVTHDHAAEILRHCIKEEYGGVFHMMKLFHNLIRVEGVPCDSVFDVQLTDESTDKFSLKSELNINANCTTGLEILRMKNSFMDIYWIG